MDELAIPHRSEVVNLESADHVFTLQVDAIYVGTAGDLVAKLRGDSEARTWKVPAGITLFGDFESVRKTGTTAAALIGLKSWGR